MNQYTRILIGIVILAGALLVGFRMGRISADTSPEISEMVSYEESEHDNHADHSDEKIIYLTDAELQEFGIELAAAAPGKIQTHVDLPGEIVPDPERLAHIVPRFPGMVREIKKRIGDQVRKGETLAIIESNESLTPFEMKSLIDGTIIEMRLAEGEVVHDETHAYQVADLNRVWVRMNVYQKYLLQIHPKQSVLVSATEAGLETEGSISYISPTLDERTRTAIARIVLPNEQGYWRPGMFVSVKVVTGETDAAIVVPISALQVIEDQTVIFIREDGGLRAQPVFTGRRNDTMVEITSGLNAGQEYVAKGTFALKAEVMKGEFGDGHAH